MQNPWYKHEIKTLTLKHWDLPCGLRQLGSDPETGRYEFTGVSGIIILGHTIHESKIYNSNTKPKLWPLGTRILSCGLQKLESNSETGMYESTSDEGNIRSTCEKLHTATFHLIMLTALHTYKCKDKTRKRSEDGTRYWGEYINAEVVKPDMYYSLGTQHLIISSDAEKLELTIGGLDELQSYWNKDRAR